LNITSYLNLDADDADPVRILFAAIIILKRPGKKGVAGFSDNALKMDRTSEADPANMNNQPRI